MTARMLAFLLASFLAVSGRGEGLEISVPFWLDAEASFEQAVIDLRRLHDEFGVRRVYAVGCPGTGARITGWTDDDASFERFADGLARVKAAVSDTGLEVGYWNAPTLACAKGGPFQFMVGHTGKTALHSPCPLDGGFVSAFCRRLRIIAGRARPVAILFEDDLHFKSQRDQTNDGWTGPCCYCPLHLAALAKKCGRRYGREELLAAMEGDSAEAHLLRDQFEETLAESMADFGRQIRAAVDEVSPETAMGLSAVGNLSGNKATDIGFARAVCGRGRPFVRISATVYDSNASMISMLDTIGHAFWDFAQCPRDILRIHEMDTYPHNRYFMPDAMAAALMAYSVSLGAEGMLFYGTQYLDDPLEADGYFRILKRERRKLEALRVAVSGLRPVGVRVVGRDPGVVSFASRYGLPLSLDGSGPAVLFGDAAKGLSDAELRGVLERGGVVVDGKSADEATRRGFSPCLGACVESCPPLPVMYERILPAAGLVRHEGRKAYNFAFAAATPAEKSEFTRILSPVTGVEPIVEFVDPLGKRVGTSVYRHESPSGSRIGVIATTVPGNRSAALFNLRKREALVNLLEWTARTEIPVRVDEEPNVMLIANADPKDEQIVLTVVNLRPDVLESLDLTLATKWLEASCEELGQDGMWRSISPIRRTVPRVRGLDGEFRPGISRVFRLRAKRR